MRSGRGGPTQVVSGTGRFVGPGRASDLDLAREAGNDVQAAEDGVTLNLLNLPIAQAAKIVLGDIVQADYVVDPKLDAKVTVHTARPVRKSQAVALFQAALRVSGAAVVENGGVYKVVPLDQAAVSGETIASSLGDKISQQKIGDSVKVVQLRYVSASEMKRVLEPIAPHGGIVRADDARSLLTLSGTSQEIATLEDAIAMFDIDTMRGMSFALVPVHSSDPDALADDLRNAFGSEKEGPMNGMIRFIGNKRLSAILAISPQTQYLTRARAWIQRLDARAEGNEKQFYTYRVQNRPAKELVQVLSTMFGSDTATNRGANVAPRFGQASISSAGSVGSQTQNPFGSAGAASTGAQTQGGNGSNFGGGLGGGGLGSGGLGGGGLGSLGNGGGSISSPTSSASGAGARNSSQAGGGQTAALGEDSRFKLAVDEAKNALVVMATPEDYKRLRQIVETLDVLPNQVFIEATIAEITLNDDLQFGVRWFLQKNASSVGFSNAATRDAATNLIAPLLDGAFPGFSYMLKAANVQVTLHALNTITNVNVISTPSLTVLDNRQAVLQVGDQVPVLTQQATSVIGVSPTINSVNYRDTGVILAITPHINESGRVMLEIEQEVSNVAPVLDSTIGSPTIQQRKVKTQVIVSDSEALMLGGLIQNSRSRGSTQVPVFGDLPVFGSAFKDKKDAIGKTELLIMITPHVMRTNSEAQEATDEFKRKLLRISAKTKARPHTIEQSARRALLDE